MFETSAYGGPERSISITKWILTTISKLQVWYRPYAIGCISHGLSATALQQIASIRSAATSKRGDPCIRELADLDKDDIGTYETQEPHMWTLVTASGEIEEITLSFQGILRHRDLPPLKISKYAILKLSYID